VIITGGAVGPTTWDENNKPSPFNTLFTRPFNGLYSVDRVAGHATLPVIYQSTMHTSWVVSAEHVDGYLTLVPQRLLIEGATLTSLPVILTKRNQVAFGGVNKVYVLPLDDQGRFKPLLSQAAVASASVEALTYSPKFDRLYVTVEKAK